MVLPEPSRCLVSSNMLKLVEGHYRALESALPAEVGKALARGPAAIVTAGAALQRRVLRILEPAGLAIMPGIEIIPGFPQLAARISGRPFSGDAVSAADRILLALEAMEGIPRGMPYAALSDTPHAARALAEFFENELLDRGIDPETYDISAKAASGTASEAGAGDAAEHEQATVEAVHIAFEGYCSLRRVLYPGTPDQVARSALETRNNRYRTLIFHGFLDLNPLQRRLLKSVLGTGAVVVFLCPVPAALEAWSDMGRPTRALLDRSRGEYARPDAGGRRPRFLEFADELLADELRSIPEGFGLVGAPGPAGVARAVMNCIAQGEREGIPPSSTAVIGRGPAFEAVESMLRMEGIRTTRPGRVPFSRLPVASLLSGIVRMRILDFHHSTLETVAGSGLLRDGIGASPDEIARAVQTAGPRKGRSMLQRIAGLENGPHRRAAGLAGALLAADAAMPRSAPVSVHLRALCSAAIPLLDPDGRDAVLLAALPDLAAARYRREIPFARFAEILGDVMEKIRLDLPGTQGGVELLEFDEARGSSFRSVIVFGIEEDVLPGVTRSDPRLPEELRKWLELSPGSLREREQALLFRQVLECAEERLTLVRMTEDPTGREVSWSPFIGPLVDLDGRTGGPAGRWTSTNLPADPLSVFFGGKPDGHSDIRGASEGRPPSGRPFFAQALAAERSRLDFGSPFGAHDGITGADAGLLRRSFSPSALQRWARCPFLYLAERVWKLAEPCSADMMTRPPANVAGSLMHSALARCLSRPEMDMGRALVEASIEQNLAGIMGCEALAGIFLESMRPVLETLLGFLADNGLSPDDGDSLEADRSAPIGPGGVSLGGRMDMILRSGGERIVLDLKTGARETREAVSKRILEGDHLQIPLYAAILSALGAPVARAGLLFSTKPSLDVTFGGEELEQMIGTALERAAGIIGRIGEGMFPPARAAGAANACQGCWAAHLCRKSPEDRISAKLSSTEALGELRTLWLADGGADAAGSG